MVKGYSACFMITHKVLAVVYLSNNGNELTQSQAFAISFAS